MSNVQLPKPDISVPFLSEVRKVPQGDYYRADKVLPLLKQWPVLYEAAKAGHEQAFAEAQNAAAVSAAKDAEIAGLRADFTALQRAIVGDTGASAILEAGRLRARVRVLEDALRAMLTHMGMDEDEWNKPTFDQARAALEQKP